MLNFIRRKLRLTLNINVKENFKYECIKICLIYVIIGCLWIYFSDRIVDKISYNNSMSLTIHTYKGWFFILITAIILYLLINNLLKKVNFMEYRLNESYEELAASEEELRAQYDQLVWNEEKLRESEQKNIAIINAIPDLLFIFDKDGTFIDCTTSDEGKLYVPKNMFIGKKLADILPNDIAKISSEKIQSVLKNGKLEKFEYELQGEFFDLRMVKNNENEVLAISRNITIERKNEYDLKISENRYRTLVNEMLQGIAIYEGNSEDEEVASYKFVGGNESHERLTNIITEKSMGKSIRDLFPQLGKESYEKLNYVVMTGKSLYYQSNFIETGLFLEVTFYSPQKLQLAVIINDITQRRQLEMKLEYLSYHDQLTGLYNRRFYEEELIRIDNEKNLPIAIIMADVNGLKLVNDSFGHAMGDELIKKVAEILKNGCRSTDIISRIAGDEFIIFLPKTTNDEAAQIVEHIKELEFKEKAGSIGISVAFGYETKMNIDENINEIIKKAENNMYKIKLFESPSVRGKTINTIISTLNEKNKREEEHSYRVSKLCEDMGHALALSQDSINELKTVGLLHDIGKIAIEENILNKPGKLTVEEFEEIKRHPEVGYRILSTVNEMSEMSEYVLAHHERWNGNGYPKKLKGEDIPLQSRIIAIADAYDAMISERSYRSALSEEAAIKELTVNAGIQFDAKLVKLFIEKVLNKEH